MPNTAASRPAHSRRKSRIRQGLAGWDGGSGSSVMLRIRAAVAVAIERLAAGIGHVDVRVIDPVLLGPARADLEQHGLAARTVLEPVAVRIAGGKGGAVAGPQHRLA